MTTTKILDTEPIYETSPARERAASAVASYRERQHLVAVTIRESSGGRSWLPEAVLKFLAADVIRPACGELQRRLYGK